MNRRSTLVTRGDWGVSTTSPRYDADYNELPGVVLHTYKMRGNRLWQHGEGYGKVFPTDEAATQWALEHGYLQPFYRRTWCPKHRVLHTFMGKPTSFCPVKAAA